MLLFSLQHGSSEAAIVELASRTGRPIPEPFASKPELLPGLSFYLQGFQWLTTCRQVGMGEGPIPWTAISAFCNENGIYGECREDFFYHIEHLDVAYLTYREKSKPPPNPPGKGSR